MSLTPRQAETCVDVEEEEVVTRQQIAGSAVDRILCVTIHGTDPLQPDPHIKHPMVKVHVVDADRRGYVKKLDSSRSGSYEYECGRGSAIDHLLPITTMPFTPHQAQPHSNTTPTTPAWGETLLFHESFHYLARAENPNTLLLFEVLDFLPPISMISDRSVRGRAEGGWYRIAWAFLKMVGKNGEVNDGKHKRLQLYHTPVGYHPRPGVQIPVLDWYEMYVVGGGRLQRRRPGGLASMRYPATLYVSVQAMVPPQPDDLPQTTRSMYVGQRESGRYSFNQLERLVGGRGGGDADDVDLKRSEKARAPKTIPSPWSRLPGQKCKLPNCVVTQLIPPPNSSGCTRLVYSHDGCYIAAAMSGASSSYNPIAVFNISECARVTTSPVTLAAKMTFVGHFSIVYDLSWAHDTSLLASASSDATVRIWKVCDDDSPATYLEECVTLPHPQFVYTVCFHPRHASVVVTGCFDQLLRIWNHQGQLLQELSGHTGYINTCTFDSSGDRLYSGDSKGVICVWNVYVSERRKKKGFSRDWTLYEQVKEKQIMGTSVQRLAFPPGPCSKTKDNTELTSVNKLFVLTKASPRSTLLAGSCVWCYDLRVQTLTHRFDDRLSPQSLSSHRSQLLSCSVSPCGNYLLGVGGENFINVWNTVSGEFEARYLNLGDLNTDQISDIAFHPLDNILTVCGLQVPTILLLSYSPSYSVSSSVLYREPKLVAESQSDQPPPPTSSNKLITSLSRPPSHLSEPLTSVGQEKLLSDQLHTSMTQGSLQPEGEAIARKMRKERVLKKISALLEVQRPVLETSFNTNLLSTMGTTWGTTDFLKTLTPSTSQVADKQQTSEQQNVVERKAAVQVDNHQEDERTNEKNKSRSNRNKKVKSQGRKKKTSSSITSQKAVALYPFSGEHHDELSFQAGEVLVVLSQNSPDWWLGHVDKAGTSTETLQQGFFPSNHVMVQS